MYQLALLAALLSVASAHSWVQCADYPVENGQFWDYTKCRGWPRDYVNKFTGTNAQTFGADVGYDYHETQIRPCLTNKTSASYSAAFPAATFSPGQRVCNAWPPKNHVRANCVNPNIPDSGTVIYRSGVNPTEDPTFTEFQANVVYNFGADTVTGAGVGFQNCPAFCTNQDKALCTGCYNIPSDLALGNYTFLWAWSFNSATDTYASCFDVQIVSNSGNGITSTLAHIGPDAFFAASATATASAAASATASSSSTAASSSSTTASSASSASTSHASTASTASTAATAATAATSSSQATTSTTTCPTAAAPSCPIGADTCACTNGGACDSGLMCSGGTCVTANNALHSSHASYLCAGMVSVLVAFVGLFLLV